MWDGLFMLLSLSCVMAVASFLAGALPLSFALSHRQLRFISALGTGVLVGTALIVIIPEGVETLYNVGSVEHGHFHRVRSIGATVLPVQGVNVGATSAQKTHMPRWEQLGSDASAENLHTLISREDEQTQESDHDTASDSSDSEESHREPHAWVGVSVVLGFILMYLIDVLPDNLSQARPSYKPLHISLSHLSRGLHRSSSPTRPSSPPLEVDEEVRKAPSTTIGLIIHAIADGIALGASSTAPSTSLSFVIFLAIMLHKAPAAFGLTSVLLKQGLSKRSARTHLVIFSLAAPAGALLTFVAVHMLGRNNLGGEVGVQWATGCMLLFSGGTFLYVAMHILSASNAGHHSHGIVDEDDGENGYVNPYCGHAGAPVGHGVSKPGPSLPEVAVVVVGMLVPLLTQVGHVH